MSQVIRPRRSLLYMPGSNPRALEKGKNLPVDGLILDLEDAVMAEAKNTARTLVCDAVKADVYGPREVVIRTNALDTKWGMDDIKAAAEAGPDAILLPKVEDAQTIQTMVSILKSYGAPEKTKIWCMMETPRAMLNAHEIAASSDMLTCFVMGTSDLVNDLHAHHTRMRLPIVTSLSLCLLAARAENLDILDGVYLDLKDEEGYAESCRQGLEFGFDGKTLIHPKQAALANETFAPSGADIELSHRIIEAYKQAVASGKGVVLVDGKLIENLHIENAKRLILLSETIKKMEADHV